MRFGESGRTLSWHRRLLKHLTIDSVDVFAISTKMWQGWKNMNKSRLETSSVHSGKAPLQGSSRGLRIAPRLSKSGQFGPRADGFPPVHGKARVGGTGLDSYLVRNSMCSGRRGEVSSYEENGAGAAGRFRNGGGG